jgi:uncharacterized protein
MSKALIKKGWVRVTFYLIALIITLLSAGILFVPISLSISSKAVSELQFIDKINLHILIIYNVICVVAVTLLTIFFRTKIDEKRIITLGFHKFRMVPDLVSGILVGFIIIVSGFIILNISGFVTINALRPDVAYLAGSIILFMLISWLEEISFRAYILGNLMESFGKYTALFISSVLFALFHMFNPGMAVMPFVNLILAGLLLGLVYIHTGTIWYALGLHFGWNFFQGPVFGFPVSGIEMKGLISQQPAWGGHLISGGNFGFEGSVFCSILIIIFLILPGRYYNTILK